MRKTAAVVIAVVSTLVIVACSSGASTSSSASTSGSAAATAGSGTANGADIAAATAYQAQFLSPPTSIGISTPLTSKPTAGKLIVGLETGTGGSSEVLGEAWAQAAAALGWKYKTLISGGTPTTQQAAMESAIQLNPAGIVTAGIPNSTLSAQLVLAKQKGIWVNSSGNPSPPSGAMYDTSIEGPAQFVQAGKMVAAYVVAHSNGKAVIQEFSLPVYPILTAFDTAFVAAIKQWCPACKVTQNPQTAADIGTTTPQAVVSAVTRNPATNWLIFDLGDLATGVNAALSAAGLHGLHIGGQAADTPNITALKNGTQDVWTAYSEAVAGYRQLDSLARKFEGMPILNTPVPAQLITPQNVNSLVVDSQGNYIGVANFRSQFLTLWHVNS